MDINQLSKIEMEKAKIQSQNDFDHNIHIQNFLSKNRFRIATLEQNFLDKDKINSFLQIIKNCQYNLPELNYFLNQFQNFLDKRMSQL